MDFFVLFRSKVTIICQNTTSKAKLTLQTHIFTRIIRLLNVAELTDTVLFQAEYYIQKYGLKG